MTAKRPALRACMLCGTAAAKWELVTVCSRWPEEFCYGLCSRSDCARRAGREAAGKVGMALAAKYDSLLQGADG